MPGQAPVKKGASTVQQLLASHPRVLELRLRELLHLLLLLGPHLGLQGQGGSEKGLACGQTNRTRPAGLLAATP